IQERLVRSKAAHAEDHGGLAYLCDAAGVNFLALGRRFESYQSSRRAVAEQAALAAKHPERHVLQARLARYLATRSRAEMQYGLAAKAAKSLHDALAAHSKILRAGFSDAEFYSLPATLLSQLAEVQTETTRLSGQLQKLQAEVEEWSKKHDEQP